MTLTYIAESPFDTMPTRPVYRRGDIVQHDGIAATVVVTSGRYVGLRFDNGATLADSQSNWQKVSPWQR